MGFFGKTPEEHHREDAAEFHKEIKKTQAELHRTTDPREREYLQKTLQWANETYDTYYR